ncbi:MAG: hypothetical protein AAF383_12800 [Cyanobacteria bacterium P01_A01_bin.83]
MNYPAQIRVMDISGKSANQQVTAVISSYIHPGRESGYEVKNGYQHLSESWAVSRSLWSNYSATATWFQSRICHHSAL